MINWQGGAFFRSCPFNNKFNLQNLIRFVSNVAFCLCFTAATRLIPLMGTRKMSLFFCASFLFLKTAFGDRPHNLRPDAATVAGALPFVLLLLTQAFSEHQISNSTVITRAFSQIIVPISLMLH